MFLSSFRALLYSAADCQTLSSRAARFLALSCTGSSVWYDLPWNDGAIDGGSSSVYPGSSLTAALSCSTGGTRVPRSESSLSGLQEAQALRLPQGHGSKPVCDQRYGPAVRGVSFPSSSALPVPCGRIRSRPSLLRPSCGVGFAAGAATGCLLSGTAYRSYIGGRHSRHSSEDKLTQYETLPELAAVVERRAGVWSATGNTPTLVAAFNRAVKVGMRSGDAGPQQDDPERRKLLQHVLGTLARAYLPLVPSLQDPKDCVIPLWAYAKVQSWEGEAGQLAVELLGQLGQGGCGALLQRATGQHHAILWWSLSAAPEHIHGAPYVAELLQASEERLSSSQEPVELVPQNCSNILLAAARLQWSSSRLLDHLTTLLAETAAANCQDLANAIYALGRLAEGCGYTPHQQDLERLAGQVRARLLRQGRHDAGRAASGFIPQHLSNMLWGCAKLAYTDSALLEPLVAAAGQAAGCMDPQAMANSLYGLAVPGCSGGAYASALDAGAAVRCLRSAAGTYVSASIPGHFSAQELSNMMWALATLRPAGSTDVPPASWSTSAVALVTAAAKECQQRRFRGFAPQNLSNAAWALAKAGCGEDGSHPAWYQGWYTAAVEAAMQPGFKSGANAQEWSNLLYALALVRHRPPAALLVGMAGSKQLRGRANAQDCANGLWALATVYGSLSQCDEHTRVAVECLVDMLSGRLGQLLHARRADEQPTEQGLCNSLWALAVMGPFALTRHSSLVEGLLREVVRRWEAGHVSAFGVEDAGQLWHVQLELRALELGGAGAGVGAGAQLSGILAAQPGLLETVRARVEAELLAHCPSLTDLQRGVLHALRHMQQQPHPAAGGGPAITSVSEHSWPPQLCRHVDAVVQLADGRRVAVEVDGPVNCLANQPYTRLQGGRVQLRDRQLAREFEPGCVVSVLHWEWEARKGQQAKEEYLRGLLLAGRAAVAAGGTELPSGGESARGPRPADRMARGVQARTAQVAVAAAEATAVRPSAPAAAAPPATAVHESGDDDWGQVVLRRMQLQNLSRTGRTGRARRR